MYIDDCVDGHPQDHGLSDIDEPINLGSSEMVTINELVRHRRGHRRDQAASRSYDLDAPKGVRGRNSDNTMILEELGWEPSISLRDGLEKTYAWVFDQVRAQTPV